MTTNIVKADEKNLKQFINFPYELYKDEPLWIGEVKMDVKHMLTEYPFWDHADKQLFLAYQDGRVAGRIAAVINRVHNEKWNEKCGMFGFFDCIDDEEVSSALFAAAKNWLKQRGMEFIRGPFNPSINHICGLLTEDFSNEPFIMMPYNFPYYEKLVKAAGFEKVKDLLAFERNKYDKFSTRFEKIIQRASRGQNNIVMRPLDVKNLEREAMIVRDIYNAAWAQNWGSLPVSEDEMAELAKQLKMVVNKKLTCVAEVDGVPAGFYICLPNLNRVLKILKGSLWNPVRIARALLAWRKIRDTRLVMLGVIPEYRKRGLDLLLIKHIVEGGVAAGYDMSEMSWLLEDNLNIINVVKECGGREMKRRYRIFQSTL
ncbi:MAG: GNAT family N-acetyltransferase [Elusimicrobia bacterium]|nr:GNAT family N-acetyltransferase [Elusimicrobiota bacterium]